MSRIVTALAGAAGRALERARLTPADRLFGKVLIHATASVVAPIAGATGSVASREAGYQSERWATNWIPDPSSAIKAFWAGQLGLAHVQEILSNHGIPFKNEADVTGNKWTYYWDNIIRSQRPRLSNEQALDLWRQHVITSDDCRQLLGFHGLTAPGDRDLLMRDRGWFELGTATDLWRQGLMSDLDYGAAIRRAGIGDVDAGNLLLTQRGVAPLSAYHGWWSAGLVNDGEYKQRLAREGVTDDAEVGRYLQEYHRLSPSQTLTKWRLGDYTFGQMTAQMQVHGFRPVVAQELANFEDTLSVPEALTWHYRSRGQYLRELRASQADNGVSGLDRQRTQVDALRPLPSLEQGVTYSRRAGFDEALAARWHLDTGIPTQYRDLAAWTGQDWTPRQLGPGAPASDWPSLDTAVWRSQVTLLTPDQGIEALRRLSGGRHQRYAQIAPGIKEFTDADLASIYQAYGWSDVHAAWHRALATPEIPVGVVLGRYRVQPSARGLARNTLLLLGYRPTDADDILDSVDAQREWRDKRRLRAMQASWQMQMFRTVEEGYTVGTYTDQQASAALQSLGFSVGEANATLTGWAAASNLAYARETIRGLRREYMQGVLSVAEVQQALQGLLLQPQAVRRTIVRWQGQRTWERRALSSAQILRYVARGLLTPAVATARLANLGWTAPDIALQLADAQGALVKAQATAAAAMARSKQKVQRQIEAVNKQHAQQVIANQKRLKALTPLKDLKTWLTNGEASEEWVTERLQAMGYPADIIAAKLLEWSKTKKSAPGPQVLPPEAPPPVSPPPPPPPALTIQAPGAVKVVGGAVQIPPNEGS